ncbi:hypothetical protein LTR37_014020 [Vermiconidia calcicola]|uniref:Uncharacterized protein n=1 Tax=Vermiconidia calcicola TaxID=1690605 RepID=A0ACC3MUR9_9PEZI|nr:hypothetical protein LTR37_014020 [Vermiconidia calcicola]
MGRNKGPRRPPAQRKPPLTHFLCLPLVTPSSKPQLEASLQTFKQHVSPQDTKVEAEAENAGDGGQESVIPAVHPKSIRPVGALHCTLGVMSLDKDKLSEATEFLRKMDVQALLQDVAGKPGVPEEPTLSTNSSGGPTTLQRPITPPKVDRATAPLTINLKGVESMHDPHKTSILYSAPMDATGRLLPFCIALQKQFKDKGFLVEDNRQLKLHATVVNTIYAKGRKRPPRHSAEQKAGESSQVGEQADEAQGHGPKANAPLKIDASAIIEKYREFIWAESVVLDRVAICEMGAKKVTDDEGNVVSEEYTEVAKISLPS